MPRSRLPERRKSIPSRNHARQEIVQEAARIMAEEGVRDFHAAKLKAAQRLNLPARDLPTNVEIDQAFGNYLRLFHPERPALHRQLLQIALKLMRLLQPFYPRLVGPVLTGNVTRFTEIFVHAVADAPEDLAFFFQDHNIAYEQSEKRLRFGGDRTRTHTNYRFSFDAVGIEVVVFSPETVREPPLSPVDGKPIERWSVSDVEQAWVEAGISRI